MWPKNHCTASQAARARRIRLGCSTPNFGVRPFGAVGGTLNHVSLKGSSTVYLKLNLVGKPSP